MKRYWPVATSLVVLVVAVAFLILSRGSSQPDEKAALAATPTPEATAASPTPYVPVQVPGGPLILPLPRGTMTDPQSIRNIESAMDTNRLQWLGKAEELMALLLVIDGDRTYCGNLCPLTAIPAEVIDRLNQECARVVLSAVRFTYQNFPEVTGAIDLYADGCTRLKSATDRLGKPVDTQAWRDARAEIVRAMRPGVTAGRAQPSLAQILPGPTPSPLRSAAAYYPEGTLTGIAAVDKFLRVMYTGDLAPLADDAVFTDMPCDSSIRGPGALPCPPGTPEGGMVSLVPFGSCSLNYVFNRDQLRESLGRREGLRLYAVYAGGNYGFYGVAIVTPQNVDYPFAYYLDESGRFVAFIACGGPRGQTPDAKEIFPPRGG